jgi:hypothetical protein
MNSRADPAGTSAVQAMEPAGLPHVAAASMAEPFKPVKAKLRSTTERLNAVLRHKDEALSPRELRRCLSELQAVVDTQVSEVEGGRRAAQVAAWYGGATPAERHDAWLLMCEQFSPDSDKLRAARSMFLAACEPVSELDEKSPVRRMLLRCCAEYLGHQQAEDGRPLDAVARFHLANGARIERLNWAGDMSPKGLKQAYGLMVNYLYDPKRLDRHRGLLAQGKIPVSSKLADLYI